MRAVATMVIIVLFCWFAGSAESFAVQAQTGVKTTQTAPKLIDLNLASREQLMTLPGIGENEAKKIIAGRPYLMKTELVKKGIVPDETFYGLVDKITIDWDAFAKKMRAEEKKPFTTLLNSKAKKVRTRSGLIYQDLVKGTGKPAAAGKEVKVNYTGWLKDGTKFDSSIDRQEPYTFVLGKGTVIRGWDEGVLSMRVGGKRLLTIPPKLGYGKEGAGGTIPPNATLIFEIELIDVGE